MTLLFSSISCAYLSLSAFASASYFLRSEAGRDFQLEAISLPSSANGIAPKVGGNGGFKK